MPSAILNGDTVAHPASRLQGVTLTRALEVTWGDCDAAGVVFYPRYYAWFDTCTHSLLTHLGLDHHHLREAFGLVGTPLVSSSASFRSSATFGDVLTAISRLVRLGGRSFTVQHQLRIGERVVVEGEEVRVWAMPGDGPGPSMRAVEPPPAIRQMLTERMGG